MVRAGVASLGTAILLRITWHRGRAWRAGLPLARREHHGPFWINALDLGVPRKKKGEHALPSIFNI
jgi:hypothetical protein